MNHRFYKLLILLATLALMFAFHLEAAAQGVDIEPNNECLESQGLGAITPPFLLNGSLDTPPEIPDIDFFSFTSESGLALVAEMKGEATGVGTLSDPFLGLFDSNCNLLTFNDDFQAFDSRISFRVPDDGAFILAASSCCDSEFTGEGGFAGTYELSVALAPPPIGSISARLVDARTGDPLPGDAPPFAFAELGQCDENSCFSLNTLSTDSEGRVVFDSDLLGAPLPVGTYQIVGSADEFRSAETELFEVSEGEAFDVGDLALVGPPISVSNIEPCEALPLQGGTCRYSLTITNSTRLRFRGLAWSLVDGFGLGSALNSTLFEARTFKNHKWIHREQVVIEPSNSRNLRFEFDVPSFVTDGAGFCTRLFLGVEPYPLLNTVSESFLFCIDKGETGFELMSAPRSQEMFESLSGKASSSSKKLDHNQGRK
jgi:hypothetical protein